MSDFMVDLSNGKIERHNSKAEPWKITLVDTGLNTMTGGRIKRIKKYVQDETFMLTYGDGVGNIDLARLLSFHRQHGKMATITAVQPPGRFGALNLVAQDQVSSFSEKPIGDGAWINGGFFVLEPSIFDYIRGDETLWEQDPLERLAKEGNLYAFKHYGFWKPMDTLRDKRDLEELWMSGKAPWKIWDEK
jgi:glucose-1-phosphate cytidylyltransferase